MPAKIAIINGIGLIPPEPSPPVIGAMGDVLVAPVAPGELITWLLVIPPNCCENGVSKIDLSDCVCDEAAEIHEEPPDDAFPPCVLSEPPDDEGAEVVYCCALLPEPPDLPCDLVAPD